MGLHDANVIESKSNAIENESENLSQAFMDVVKWYLIVYSQLAHVYVWKKVYNCHM